MYVNHMSQPLVQRLRTAEEPASEILSGAFPLQENTPTQQPFAGSFRAIVVGLYYLRKRQ